MRLADEPAFRLGGAQARPAERVVVIDGEAHTLEPKVMEVLVALRRADGAVVSRDALIEACWGGRAVSDDAIQRVIARLRRLSELSEGRDFSIETIAKVGYRLVAAELAPMEAPAIAPAQPPQPALRSARAGGLLRVLAVLAAVIGVAVAAFMLAPRAGAPRDDGPLTLAVLPFENDGTLPAYVAPGIGREIRDRLCRMRGLRVIAESSADAVAGEGRDAPATAGRLGADLLIEGIVERGELLRIRIDAVDGKSGAVVWSTAVEGDPADIGAVEAEASAALTEYLLQRLGPETTQATVALPPRDPRHYAMLLEARHRLYEARDSAQSAAPIPALASLREAEALADAVLADDPSHATALVIKAELVRIAPGAGDNPRTYAEQRAAAIALYQRALRADPNDVSAQVALANIYRRHQWRWSESERLLRRALTLDPNNADAHIWYAYHLSSLGRCREALVHAEAAASLAPVSNWHQFGLPRIYKCLGDFAAADRLYDAEFEKQPGNLFLAREIYIYRLLKGDAGSLRAMARRARAMAGGAEAHLALARRIDAGAAALEGRPAALLSEIANEERDLAAREAAGGGATDGRHNPDLVFLLSLEAAVAGDVDAALRLLQTALAGRSLYVSESLPYGIFEYTPAVRADPRYKALWRTDPALAELVAQRLESIRNREMAGFDPDGGRVTAKPVETAAGQ